MDKLIQKYFTAWETKNDTLLEEVLTPNFKGIRTFFEEKLYNLDDVLFTLRNKRDLKYTLLSSDYRTDVSYVDAYLEINGKSELITIKFTFEDDLIKSVYETSKLINKTRVKCVVSYDGSIFNGYQKQPTKDTVQDALENALESALSEKIKIHGSGRTDKGVHAYNQVIHFDTSTKIKTSAIMMVVNKILPDGIYIKSSEEVHETFHSRYDIKFKEYVYVINKQEYDVIKRNYEWYPGDFDSNIFKKEIESIVGTYDFTSLTKTNDLNNVRTIFDVAFHENQKYLHVHIKGNGFLRYMVRNIIAGAMNVAKGKNVSSLKRIIEKKDNTLLKDIAPSSGLYMNEVNYNL